MSEKLQEFNLFSDPNSPDEILLEIFNYFDGKSLKILSFVCKRQVNCLHTLKYCLACTES